MKRICNSIRPALMAIAIGSAASFAQGATIPVTGWAVHNQSTPASVVTDAGTNSPTFTPADQALTLGRPIRSDMDVPPQSFVGCPADGGDALQCSRWCAGSHPSGSPPTRGTLGHAAEVVEREELIKIVLEIAEAVICRGRMGRLRRDMGVGRVR